MAVTTQRGGAWKVAMGKVQRARGDGRGGRRGIRSTSHDPGRLHTHVQSTRWRARVQTYDCSEAEKELETETLEFM